MLKNLTKKQKLQIGLFGLSIVLMIIGVLFLVNAMQEDPSKGFFKAFCAIDNVLAKYIVVLLFMSSGIMLFSNVATRLDSKKLRNGVTIGITTFAFVLTLPLVYVFVALFPYAANGSMGPVGKVMGVNRIFDGFSAWFGTDALLWVVLVIMLIIGIVFLLFPLVTGTLAVKGKEIKVGKKVNGKFGVWIGTLGVIAKQQAVGCKEEDCACCCGCAAAVAADEEDK